MKKILIVFGTRPEAIKLAPLIKEFEKHTDIFNTKVCVTAQHRQMLDQVLEIFNIKPDFDLNLMKAKQSLNSITSNVLLGMKPILDEFEPEIVFVHGDTSTTFSTALACYYQRIDIAHVEAGLRTYDIYSPWPEEANRQLTSKLTKFHFAPTEISKQNLLNEGIKDSAITVTGNTVIDALFLMLEKIDNDKTLQQSLIKEINLPFDILNSRYILVTGHRRENFGQGFINICEALNEIAEKNRDIQIVYPVHLNPNVQEPVLKLLSGTKNIHLIAPLDYESFVFTMSKSYFIITDSGGIQEEAPSIGKPVLVTRDTTERPEAIEAGTAKLVGTNREKIVTEAEKLLLDENEYKKVSLSKSPYGDGFASKRIIEFIS